ncbi:MAG: N-acetyltransferase family protein [Aquabacterium sp.]
MIREASDRDIPALVALGRAMHDESPRWCRLAYDAEKVANTLRVLVGAPWGYVWVAEDADDQIVGGMVAAATAHWSSADLVATDLALFVAPAARGGLAPVRLLRAYRAWAVNVGAKLVQVGITTGVQTEESAALMERVGFRRCGVVLEA